MNKEIKERIEDGAILFQSIIEIVGKPQEHVEEAIDVVLGKIKEDKVFEITEESKTDAKEVEDADGMFSIFADITVVTDNLSNIYDFIFRYMPASIEIIEPEGISLNKNDATGVLNDFVGRIHQIDMHAKKMNQENKLLSENLGIMILNSIVIFLSKGPQAAETIGKAIGVKADQLKRFLDKLEKDKRIEKEGDKYRIVKE